MKRKAICDLTEQEAADELTFLEVKSLLRKARKENQKAEAAQKLVFQAIEDMCIDIDITSGAENADTLGDAISCFIQYGEYGIKNIMREIKAQYLKEDKTK